MKLEDIEKINRLAKILKEQGFASTTSEAVNIASKFIQRGEATLKEISCPNAEQVLKELEKEEKATAQEILDSVQCEFSAPEKKEEGEDGNK